MGRKDKYLDYAANRKKRKYSSKKETHSLWFTKGKAVLLVFTLALIFGGGVYYISDYFIEAMNFKTSITSYHKVNNDGNGSKTIGPFGLLEDLEAVEIPVSVETTEEVFMKDFVDTRTPVTVKGIYLTSGGANKTLDSLIALVNRTELNAVVIDIKDDDGYITFAMNGDYVDKFSTSRSFINDIEITLKKLKENNIYVIARIVAFKDPILGNLRPDLALHMNDGSVYKDYSDTVWLNPLKQEVLDYLFEVAAYCAEIGFDEINFDYIRFPTDGNIADIDLGEEAADKTKIDAITQAVKYLCENIKPLSVYVSADVFGGIITSAPDQRNVGQSYVELSKYLDYICPMIYPSHYANGYYGIDYPDTQPYKMMYYALMDSRKVLKELEDTALNKAEVRPWLQDFTASWLKNYIPYGEKEVRAQIEAVYDAGYNQWFLWNASMNYTEDALMAEEEADRAFLSRPSPSPSPTPTKAQGASVTPKLNTGQYFESPWKSDN